MMYEHILTRLINTPLFISQAKLDIITNHVTLPILRGETVQSIEKSQPTPTPELKANIAVVKVFGTLVAKNGGGDSGSTSYLGLQSRVSEILANQNTTDIIFHVDSQGGEGSGLFPFCSFIKSISSKYGVRTWGYTDGSACSAAYAILSSCDQAYASPSSNVGSIGAVMTLIDVTKMDEKSGITYHILRDKEEKALYNPHEPMSEAVLTKAKETLMTFGAMFDKLASDNTGLSIDSIKGFKGSDMLADKALEAGLISGISASLPEFIESIVLNFNNTNGVVTMNLPTNQQTNSNQQTNLNTNQPDVSMLVAEAIKAERDRTTGILAAQKTFGVSMESAVKCIQTGMSLDNAKMMFEMVKESTQMANSVPTSGDSSTINTNFERSAGETTIAMSDILSKAFDLLDGQPKPLR